MHLATAWEAIADVLPDAAALVSGETRRSWQEYDERASRFAAFLNDQGVGQETKVGIYSYNSSEYLEAQFGTFKVRACSINVNYRYTAEELVYLLDNADAEVLVYQACFRNTVAAIAGELPRLRATVEVDDGTPGDPGPARRYEEVLASFPPLSRVERKGSDLYMLYTGGTTGMPKGVMYEIGTFVHALMRPYETAGMERPTTPEEIRVLAPRVHAAGASPVALPVCPFMHGTGMWIGAMVPHNMGGAVVTMPDRHFDPTRVLAEVARARITHLVIVGDAFARPLVAELDRAQAAGEPHDISSLTTITSSGAIWSKEVKSRLLEYADLTLIDAMGSTEGGMGRSEMTRDTTFETAKFELQEGVQVFDENDRPVAAGSGKTGLMATSGLVPIGYYKDPEKSAATFREIDGVRYSFPGDHARVEADGTITLLGRGSSCINTGGEKVYPEEVEEALKLHPSITDCLVVGLPDERFGERVVAVAAAVPGAPPGDQELIDLAREHLAGYKLPKQLVFVDRVQRSPSGKPDYAWARELARERLGA
jgi:fatty-acyl-CoA synthase